jgi:hypothetical protein
MTLPAFFTVTWTLPAGTLAVAGVSLNSVSTTLTDLLPPLGVAGVDDELDELAGAPVEDELLLLPHPASTATARSVSRTMQRRMIDTSEQFDLPFTDAGAGSKLPRTSPACRPTPG